MEWFSLFVFLVMTYSLGFLVSFFCKESENSLEKNIMRFGIGLSFLIAFSLILNLLRIPIDFRILTGIGILGMIIGYKKIKAPSFKITKSDIYIFIVLIIFLFTFFMYHNGAFSYPYLEDDDSWAHAIGVKFVSIEKTVFPEKSLRYIYPYPPSYDLVFGILHQTNDSIYWTLKYFNALIISMSILFFYFFAKELMNKSKALAATFILAAIPAFMSHFIWSIALNVPLYFIAFYSLERIKHDKKWIITAALTSGVALIVSPSHGAYFAAFLAIYALIKLLALRKDGINYAIASVLGVIVSLVLWWIPSFLKFGFMGTIRRIGGGGQGLAVAGTGDRVYTISDFFIAQGANMINNPIGIGLVASLLAVVFLILFFINFSEKFMKYWKVILITYLVIVIPFFTFLWATYTKIVPKRNVQGLAPGSTPFFEYFFNLSFFNISLLVFLLVFVTIGVLIWKKESERYDLLLTLAWLSFSFYALNASPFVNKLSPFRVWSIFAIPLAIIAGDGFISLVNIFKNSKVLKFSLSALIIIGVLFTSFSQKYEVNTASWQPGGFWSYVQDANGRVSSPELLGYLWMKDNLAPNTPIFHFTNNGPIIGNNMFACQWCQDVLDYQKAGYNDTSEETNRWLKSKNYPYLIIDAQTAKKFGPETIEPKLKDMIDSGKFKVEHNTDGFILLRVV